MKELLGRHEITMTMRYAHLAPGQLREAVSCLDEMFVETAPKVEARVTEIVATQTRS